MFGALKRGFRSMANLRLVVNVVGELQRKRTLAASRGFLAAARLSCYIPDRYFAWNFEMIQTRQIGACFQLSSEDPRLMFV